MRDALAYGATVTKPPYFPPFDVLLPEPAIPGEDSLNLNIWTPDPGRADLPVLVWIHGGAFANGTGAIPTYDGNRFARDGVVCVTINYRLGVDGFLFLGQGNANLGLLDQVAALAWIQENIAAFGGDPHNVTIAGQSAGGMSADVFARPDPALWGEVAANLMPFEPVIDGDVLPARPIDRIAAGAGAEIEVLVGATTEEERLFLVPNDAIKAINEDILAAVVAAYGLPVSETLATYRATRPAANVGDIYEAIYTDWFFRIRVGFITRGDPGWPQYDLEQRQTMHFDASSELLKDPRRAERALWEGLR